MLRKLRVVLLLTAVLAGQWLAVAHTMDHAALQTADVLCSYCVSGMGPAHPPSQFPADIRFVTSVAVVEAQRPAKLLRPVWAALHIRGPPRIA